MKAIAKFLTAVTIVALLACVYVMASKNLRVSLTDVTVQLAADVPERFAEAYNAATNGYAGVTMFAERMENDAQAYNVVTYTYTVSNWGPLPAEWLVINLTPEEGDVLEIHAEIDDVPGFNQITATATLLIPWGSADYDRAMTLSYFSYGHSVSVTCP